MVDNLEDEVRKYEIETGREQCSPNVDKVRVFFSTYDEFSQCKNPKMALNSCCRIYL